LDDGVIVLTGSDGFIGQNFQKALSGKEVLCVDTKDAHRLLYSFKEWDKVELIIHQGAISSTTEKDARLLYTWNVEYTLELFDIAIAFGIPVKYASSASVYGDLEGAFNPKNQYAISKLTIDYWVQDNIDRFSSIQGFRYFNVYGDHEEHKGDQASPVSKFTEQIKTTGSLKLFEGSDAFKRDFICVDDLVDIVLNNDKPSGIYDLGTSNPVSFEHVALEVAKRYDGSVEMVPFPDHLIGKYQAYTCAKPEWGDYKFITVEEYLNGKP
jgi:ADP-L-glycero-D-manno-heptose 6-epimerase